MNTFVVRVTDVNTVLSFYDSEYGAVRTNFKQTTLYRFSNGLTLKAFNDNTFFFYSDIDLIYFSGQRINFVDRPEPEFFEKDDLLECFQDYWESYCRGLEDEENLKVKELVEELTG